MMSKTARQNPPPCKDRTIRTRQQRLHEEQEDEDTIRYALTNGATAAIEREDEDDRIQ